MFGLIVWCVIIFIIFQNARKRNEENKRRRDRLQEQAAQQQQSRPSSSKTNRALESVRKAMQQMQQVQPSYESPQEKSAETEQQVQRQTVQRQAVPQRQMPIETRRKQQQEASDRSRIHQNLHKKEADGQREKAVRAAVENEPHISYEIRFGEGELMDEVYDIMACGYPSARSGQRDFIAEGQALLDRYSLAQ